VDQLEMTRGHISNFLFFLKNLEITFFQKKKRKKGKKKRGGSATLAPWSQGGGRNQKKPLVGKGGSATLAPWSHKGVAETIPTIGGGFGHPSFFFFFLKKCYL
jgi:hypothetical protein